MKLKSVCFTGFVDVPKAHLNQKVTHYAELFLLPYFKKSQKIERVGIYTKYLSVIILKFFVSMRMLTQ